MRKLLPRRFISENMKKYTVLPFIIILLFLILHSNSPVHAQTPTPGDWWTVAANPQRTSRVPQEVTAGNNGPVWYRPIEAFIPMNSQIITWHDQIYISTSRGMYVMKAVTGAIHCRFDTEMPLGNSPTVVEGIAYVGGYDKKIHAIDTVNVTGGMCPEKWSFDGAEAGYSANPLVVNNTVYAPNRDGRVYALNVTNGSLLWQYPPAGQAALGPIHQSAAYHNGAIYFASMDNYGYAVTTNGTLKWKSPSQMWGDGPQSFWPVIYTSSGGASYVTFFTSYAYRDFLDPGTNTIGGSGSTSLFQLEASEIGSFPSGIFTYHKNKPWRRVSYMMDAATGAEYTIPSNNGYIPFAMTGTHSGTRYPVIIGSDNAMYGTNPTNNKTPIPDDAVVKWTPGSTSVSYVGVSGSVDEPQALSAGGSIIYRNLCCSRSVDWMGSSGGNLFTINDPLIAKVPNFNPMWWGFDWNKHEGIVGNYGYNGKGLIHDPTPGRPSPTPPPLGLSGIYHEHGQQNPVIPYSYNGVKLLLFFRGNTVFAYGNAAPIPTPKLGILRVNPKKDTVRMPSTTELQARLDTEIQKMISAGLLRPGYYANGQVAAKSPHDQMATYFDNPGETLLILSRAYPLVSSGLQSSIRTYLQTIFNTYFNVGGSWNAGNMICKIGWNGGTKREWAPFPTDLVSSANSKGNSTSCGASDWSYNPINIYAMWKYAELFPSDVSNIYKLAKSKLQYDSYDLTKDGADSLTPFNLNNYIAQYIGFIKLQDLAGMAGTDASIRNNVISKRDQLLRHRVDYFRKDSSIITDSLSMPEDSSYHLRMFNLSRNFIWMVPELGDYFYQNGYQKIKQAIDEYNQIGPYWFSSRYDATMDEGARQPLYDLTMLQGKAYALKEPKEELYKYLDVPTFEKGDLIYLNNLITVMETPLAPTPTNGPSPTSTPMPTPCIPQCSGKSCGDDGCWGSCGTCGNNLVCTLAGSCSVPSPTPADTVISTESWQNKTITPSQSGQFTIEYDSIPLGNYADAITAFSASPGSQFDQFAVLIRYSPNGMIDARNGGTYSYTSSPVFYTANTVYHFKVDFNTTNHTYSVAVRPQGEIGYRTIATNFAFRSEQGSTSSIGNWGVIAGSNGAHTVSSLRVATGCETGDVTCDGSVNGEDLLLILGEYGILGVSTGEDINMDGKVNIIDAGVVVKNWGG